MDLFVAITVIFSGLLVIFSRQNDSFRSLLVDDMNKFICIQGADGN